MLGLLKLSIIDVIVSQKGSNGDGKLHLFGRDYILFALFAQKYIFGQRYMLSRSSDPVTSKNFINVSVRYQGAKCYSQKVILSAWKCCLKWVCAFDIDWACNQNRLEGNILHCTKRT